VDEVHITRLEMEAICIEFVGPVYVAEKHAWTNFRAPDGYLSNLFNNRLPGLQEQ
jgi:hypothetical protein